MGEDSDHEELEEQREEAQREYERQLQALNALEESRPLAMVTWAEAHKPAEGILSLSLYLQRCRDNDSVITSSKAYARSASPSQ